MHASSHTQTFVLQLKWFHQFQFAGYYIALEKGFFEAEGLQVEIREGNPKIKPNREVLEGRAHFGVLASELIEKRIHGEPLVLLAVVMQHSLRALIFRDDSDIRGPGDLVSKKIMLNLNEQAEFMAMLHRESVNTKRLLIQPKDRTANVKFFNGKVDVINGSIANQPFLFSSKGIQVRTIRPIDYGVDFYGDSLFTSEAVLQRYPDEVAAFRRASLKGWDYAFQNIDETIALIQNKYKSRKTEAHLKFEAQKLRSLILPRLVELGHINPGRVQRIADTYNALGIVSGTINLERFLYQPDKIVQKAWVKDVIWISGSLIVFIIIVAILWHFRSRRQYLEQALHKAEMRNRLILDSAGEGIYGLDLEGNTTFVNPAAARMVGWEANALIGKPQHDMIHHTRADGTPYPKQDCFIYAAFKEGRTHTISNEVFWRKDGTSFPVEYISTPIYDEGVCQGAVVVFRDITERKRQEAIINRANQEIKEFTYVASHDLQEPLRTLSSYIEYLREDLGSACLNNDAVQEDMRFISEAASRMRILIQDLLGYSRAGRLEFTPQSVNLNHIMSIVVTNLKRSIEESRASVVWDNLPTVQGDASSLSRVLQNLVGNALKFRQPDVDPEIFIQAEPTKDGWSLQIADNGIGMETKYLALIFQPFKRLHGKQKYPGSGLGLSIVNKIIQHHKGTIQVTSEPGSGTIFTITLPSQSGHMTARGNHETT
ncbi:ABC transporter substrate-binding protein [Magnetococcales bacterium HHB-1]